MALTIVRLIVLAVAMAAGFGLGPSLGITQNRVWLAGAGFLLGVLAVVLEWQARRIPVDRLFWGAAGGILGLAFGLGLGTALGAVVPGAGPLGRGLFGLLLAYLGSMVALAKRDELEDMSAKLFPRAGSGREAYKILDTSVIIDGRIVDVCESGFLEGTLLVPQFVLRELQQIADSSDGLKRNRAKRGFDVLEKLQRASKVSVRIDGRDFPQTREVDRKLLELVKVTGGKVVTNDYALNRLAGLSGVTVLNVNELANALRPIVLPGEPMQVHVVKEGKEAAQGVGYLDDGTMVVIDHGKRFIGQKVDVTVTTVLQTAAGRMIFARLPEDSVSR
ncbi:MAG TPA: TRAM domain-containing protein [Candidatus Methylomirabilis sp.]|nr:TRAM domain-containing protein [Candidatus Methylomirabilis sp.]